MSLPQRWRPGSASPPRARGAASGAGRVGDDATEAADAAEAAGVAGGSVAAPEPDRAASSLHRPARSDRKSRALRPLFLFGYLALALGVLMAVVGLGGALQTGAGHGATAETSTALAAVVSAGQLISLLASMLCVGWLLVPAFLLDTSGGPLDTSQRRCLRPAALWSIVWAVASGVTLVVSVADALGGSLLDAARPSVISAYVSQIDQGRALLYAALIALAIAVLTPGTRSAGAATAVLALALLALVLPSMGGHASTGHTRGRTALAVPMIGLHMAALGIWFGGLVALVLLSRQDGQAARRGLPRYSALALGCFLAVGISGVVVAATRVESWTALLDCSYGRLLILKVGLFVVLGIFGYLQRSHVLAHLADLGTSAVFRRIAAYELLFLVATIAVGVGLSRTPPPPG